LRGTSGSAGNEQGFAGCDQQHFALIVFGKEFRLGEDLFPPCLHCRAFRNEEAADSGPSGSSSKSATQ
jgi:hypothetical protein